MNKSLRPATRILQDNRHLQQLIVHAQQLSQLQQLLHQQLAPAAREHVRLGNYQDGILTLVMEDAAWATRLRYQQQRMLSQLTLHAEFAALRQIRFKIRPAPSATPATSNERLYVSDAASEQILQAAEELDDPRLRAALRRLAGNVRQD